MALACARRAFLSRTVRYFTQLSHVDMRGLPKMVDVSSKQVTIRSAHARSVVLLPAEVAQLIETDSGSDGNEVEIQGKKGPVIATAIVAGVMAAKKTADLIPFCHPLPVESCDLGIRRVAIDQLDIADNTDNFEAALLVDCHVKTTHRTGVEMEALTGASIASLTLYDMLKAVSHRMVIAGTALVSKKGGQGGVFTAHQTVLKDACPAPE